MALLLLKDPRLIVSGESDNGNTPLHSLFTRFDDDKHKAQLITHKLIDGGIDVNKLNKSGLSALHVAVIHN